MAGKSTKTDKQLRSEAQAALDMLASCANNRSKACAKLGISEGQFGHRVRNAKLFGMVANVKPSKERVASYEERLEIRIKSLEQENKKLLEERVEALTDEARLDAVQQYAFGLAQKKPKLPRWSAKSHGDKLNMVPMVLASDWHYGEVVNKIESGGLNAFNPEIGDQRIERLTNLIIRTCRDHNYDYSDGIVCCLGGDMISGDDLHDELTDTNAAKTTVILLRVMGCISAMLERLADEFGKVLVPCVVGNHGRNTKKPRYKKRVETNYEWLLYKMLEKHFKADQRVTFVISSDADCAFKVHTHRYLLTHGDAMGVKGGDGHIGVLGPIMRGKMKMSRLCAETGQAFDTLLMGHYHTYQAVNGLVVNGSLKGYDEYARLCLRTSFEEPRQALWFNHPSYGPTGFEPLVLEKQLERK